MAHLGNSEPITTINNEEVIFTTTDGLPLRMKLSDLAEALRTVIPVATEKRNGLLSSNIFSMFTSGFTPFKGMSPTDDLNQLFLINDAGITAYSLISAAINSPGVGFMLHFQRLGKGSVAPGSQMIFQLVILMQGRIRYRTGMPSESSISYSNWVEV